MKSSRKLNGLPAPSVCVDGRAAYAQMQGLNEHSSLQSASAQHSLGFIASAEREVPGSLYGKVATRKQEITSSNKPGLVVSQERLFQVSGIKNSKSFTAGFAINQFDYIGSLANDCAPILRWIFRRNYIGEIKSICAQRNWLIEEVR